MSIDWTKPIERRDGAEAHYIGRLPDPAFGNCPHVVAVRNCCDSWYFAGHPEDTTEFRNVEPELKQYQNQFDSTLYVGWHSSLEGAVDAGVSARKIGIIERTLKGGKLVGVRIVPESEWRQR